MKLATDLKAFLADWRNLLAIGTLGAVGAWVYSRVWMVNPAILGDEYLYSINARKVGPWDPAPVGDFSNYLFNFVYQSTNLCGGAFYTCGKILNLIFFLGFIFIIFLVALRFLPFWGAYAFMIAAGLSPLSVYTSMFLPESMYFFFIGLLLLAVLKAATNFTVRNWVIAGAVIGIASLVKPHAWLSAIAVGITLVVIGLTQKNVGFKGTLFSGLALVGGAIISRVIVGLAVGGTKALGFFGQYLGLNTIQDVVSGTQESGAETPIGAGPMDGVVALFTDQLNIHILTIMALMGIAVIGLAIALIDLIQLKELRPVNAFGLFAFIWLFSMMVEIVIFTGWITGYGDDHSTRVLLRYYDFLFVIVPLAGLSVFAANLQEKVNVFVRWGLAIAIAALITPAFSGFFGTLTIQIADAPNLAGLVVNNDVFNGAALVGFAAVVLFATFPRFTAWSFLALLPFTLIGTGWQIQDQYQGFRAELSPSDKAGQYINANFTQEQIDRALILATSRFDATNVAIWADSSTVDYEIYGPGSQYEASMAAADTSFIVTSGDLGVVGEFSSIIPGDGFTIYLID
jgi:hypothetical protein